VPRAREIKRQEEEEGEEEEEEKKREKKEKRKRKRKEERGKETGEEGGAGGGCKAKCTTGRGPEIPGRSTLTPDIYLDLKRPRSRPRFRRYVYGAMSIDRVPLY